MLSLLLTEAIIICCIVWPPCAQNFHGREEGHRNVLVACGIDPDEVPSNEIEQHSDSDDGMLFASA